MADLIEVTPGMIPWEPMAELERVYHQYDMPLLGVVRQRGVNFLFRCISGEIGPFNLWSYSILEDDEFEELDQLGDEHTTALVDEIGISRPGVLAIAIEDGEGVPRIVLLSHHEEAGPEAMIEALVDLKAGLDQYIERMQGGRESFDRTLLAI